MIPLALHSPQLTTHDDSPRWHDGYRTGYKRLLPGWRLARANAAGKAGHEAIKASERTVEPQGEEHPHTFSLKARIAHRIPRPAPPTTSAG